MLTVNDITTTVEDLPIGIKARRKLSTVTKLESCTWHDESITVDLFVVPPVRCQNVPQDSRTFDDTSAVVNES
jgi:hypothetical protein